MSEKPNPFTTTLFQLTMLVASRGTITPQFLSAQFQESIPQNSPEKENFALPPRTIGKRRGTAYEARQNKKSSKHRKFNR